MECSHCNSKYSIGRLDWVNIDGIWSHKTREEVLADVCPESLRSFIFFVKETLFSSQMLDEVVKDRLGFRRLEHFVIEVLRNGDV